jgi:murein DD-endopeptidase MepM/ murein hydrolase activator NlpD
MSKVKYYYDTELLAYKKIDSKKRTTVGYVLLFITASALFGFFAFLILLNTPFLETPKNKAMTRQVENLTVNYKILNSKLNEISKVAAALEERDNNIYRSYFNIAEIPAEERKSKFDKTSKYDEIKNFDGAKMVLTITKKIDDIEKSLAVQSKSYDKIVTLAKEKDKFLSAIPAIQPVRNENLKRVASGFGYRTDPFTKVRKMHEGMDFTAPTGSPIYATGDGVVVRADSGSSGYGNHVEIRHGFGYETLYAHLSRYNCRPGQHVKRGDIIGYVGSTGRSQAPHLHYEVHKDGQVVNPINFYYGNISAVEYIAIAQSANQENQSYD